MSIDSSNTLKYLASATGELCYLAAYAVAGHKAVLGAGYKISGAVAEFFDKQKALEWNKSGDDYLALAKKDVVYDLKLAGSIMFAGFALCRYGTIETIKEQSQRTAAGMVTGTAACYTGIHYVQPLLEAYITAVISSAWDKTHHLVVDQLAAPLIAKTQHLVVDQLAAPLIAKTQLLVLNIFIGRDLARLVPTLVPIIPK